jgi:hypothetical protein
MQTNQIAQTILAQLGGHKFIAMTGSRQFMAFKDGLRFNLFRNTSSANRCHITLRADDTYHVHFYKLNKKTFAIKNVTEHQGVYCDQLQDVFTTVTGLYTSLGTLK